MTLCGVGFCSGFADLHTGVSPECDRRHAHALFGLLQRMSPKSESVKHFRRVRPVHISPARGTGAPHLRGTAAHHTLIYATVRNITMTLAGPGHSLPCSDARDSPHSRAGRRPRCQLARLNARWHARDSDLESDDLSRAADATSVTCAPR